MLHQSCAVQYKGFHSPLTGKIKLAEPPAQQVERVDVDILMGLDYYHDFITESGLVLPNGLYLVQSAFGYIPSGNINTTQYSEHEVLTVSSTEQGAYDETFELNRFWKIEHVGIEQENQAAREDTVTAEFEDSI